MDNIPSLNQKVTALRDEISDFDFKKFLLKFLSISEISIEDAILSARRIIEYITTIVIEKEGFELQRDLMGNLETLGSTDKKSFQRRKENPPILPNSIYSSLHNLRIYGNIIAHPFEPGTTALKNEKMTDTDVQVALGQLLKITEWYLGDYKNGPCISKVYNIPNDTNSNLKTKQKDQTDNTGQLEVIKLIVDNSGKVVEQAEEISYMLEEYLLDNGNKTLPSFQIYSKALELLEKAQKDSRTNLEEDKSFTIQRKKLIKQVNETISKTKNTISFFLGESKLKKMREDFFYERLGDFIIGIIERNFHPFYLNQNSDNNILRLDVYHRDFPNLKMTIDLNEPEKEYLEGCLKPENINYLRLRNTYNVEFLGLEVFNRKFIPALVQELIDGENRIDNLSLEDYINQKNWFIGLH